MIRWIRIAICLLILLSAREHLCSQVSHHSGIFPTIDHSGSLTKRLDYSFYYFGAFNLVNSEINELREQSNFFAFYSEQALTLRLNEQWSLTGSYVYERQHPTGDSYRNENRVYVQLQHKYTTGKASIKHRLRYDARFIEDRLTDEDNFTSRVRYLIGIKIPLKNERLYFNGYNEFFFNTFKSSSAIYSENWAYVGVGQKLNENHSLEFGPLYIFWVNSNRNDLRNFYYLQLSWNSYIDWNKRRAAKPSE